MAFTTELVPPVALSICIYCPVVVYSISIYLVFFRYLTSCFVIYTKRCTFITCFTTICSICYSSYRTSLIVYSIAVARASNCTCVVYATYCPCVFYRSCSCSSLGDATTPIVPSFSSPSFPVIPRLYNVPSIVLPFSRNSKLPVVELVFIVPACLFPALLYSYITCYAPILLSLLLFLRCHLLIAEYY